MKRGKHYRQCNVINSSLTPISHARLRRKEVQHISINMNFSWPESTWKKKKKGGGVSLILYLFFHIGINKQMLVDQTEERTKIMLGVSLYMAQELYRYQGARQECGGIFSPYIIDLQLVFCHLPPAAKLQPHFHSSTPLARKDIQIRVPIPQTP